MAYVCAREIHGYVYAMVVCMWVHMCANACGSHDIIKSLLIAQHLIYIEGGISLLNSELADWPV